MTAMIAPRLATVEELDGWLAAAGHRDRFVYAEAERLPIRCAVGKRAYALAVDDLITIVQPKLSGGAGYAYTAVRTAKPTLAQQRTFRCLTGKAELTHDEDRVLREIEIFADADLPMPTHTALAQAMAVPPSTMWSILARLVEKGELRIDRYAGPLSQLFTVATVLSSGAATRAAPDRYTPVLDRAA
jgi:hypothetical protein